MQNLQTLTTAEQSKWEICFMADYAIVLCIYFCSCSWFHPLPGYSRLSPREGLQHDSQKIWVKYFGLNCGKVIFSRISLLLVP